MEVYTIPTVTLSKFGYTYEPIVVFKPANNTTSYNSNFTNQEGDPSDSTQLHYLETLPVYILIFLTAVIGNSLVIATLIQNKRMRTVTNVFLLNLSISDLLLAVFCMPFTLVPMMLHNFIFGPVMCVLIRYLQGEI